MNKAAEILREARTRLSVSCMSVSPAAYLNWLRGSPGILDAALDEATACLHRALGEKSIFLRAMASISLPNDVAKRVFDRAIELAEKENE